MQGWGENINRKREVIIGNKKSLAENNASVAELTDHKSTGEI